MELTDPRAQRDWDEYVAEGRRRMAELDRDIQFAGEDKPDPRIQAGGRTSVERRMAAMRARSLAARGAK